MKPSIPTTADRFAELVVQARACRACTSMEGRRRVLSPANGPCPAPIMLVGEAPGRLGAQRSGIPFEGDVAGQRLACLIIAAGWSREELFITNAVLCNPLDESGRNRAPLATEVVCCNAWLTRQMELVNPQLVVALGRVALDALRRIQAHPLTVRDASSLPSSWNGRWLAAAYHPSARAAIHRPLKRQISDFEALGNWWRTPRLHDTS